MTAPHRGLLLLSLALAVAAGFPAAAQDAPDLRREKRLHQIYKKFNAKPTPQEKWQEALSSTKDQTYTLEKGDTLWDVSDTFFGDPEFWPKIWALNKQGIFNPHEITPGDQIQFTPGTLGEPPVFDVADGEAPKEGAAAGAGGEFEEEKNPFMPNQQRTFVDVDLGALDLPPPRRRPKPGVTTPPKSFPNWSMRKGENTNIVTQLDPITMRAPPNQIDILSFVQDERLQAVGEIVETEEGGTLAHDGQHVVIRSRGAAPGQRLLVARHVGRVSGRQGSGYIIEVDGEVLLGEPVGSNLHRALVTKAFNPIATGGLLVPGDVERVPFSGGGAGSDAMAFVVGGAHGDNRTLFGPGEILFLDGGGRSGLSAGQVLNVYRVEKARTDGESRQVQNPRLIGAVRVVRATGKFATALVVSATEEIEVGDSTTRALQSR